MKLDHILTGIEYNVIQGNPGIEIGKIQYDSRKVSKGDLFVAISGFSVDGHKFIDKAVENGAVAVIIEKDIDVKSGITYIKTEDTRKVLAMAAANYYGHPADRMKVIGFTGTNGKTTSTFMMKSILEKAGYKVGVIGTIANYIGNEVLHTDRTTPESLELQELFKNMVDKNVDYCIMEVSSHSLVLHRVYGIKFSEAVFTNLTQDHLDFHKTFENYFLAKSMLFSMTESSVINNDDEYGRRLEKMVGKNVTTYSVDGPSQLKGENLKLESTGVEFDCRINDKNYNVQVSIPGRFNVYNALGCMGAALNEGISPEIIIDALKTVNVPGRSENLTIGMNLGFHVIRDYSHTPDSLEKILESLRELTKGRLICVFGCGGDRDRTKRPIMGRIGTELSDIAIITSDNPRSEDPYEIIEEIKTGVHKDNYQVVENRREAIKKAMTLAEAGDVIVIAGKGHETYQVLKDKTIHFDEKEVVAELIEELRL